VVSSERPAPADTVEWRTRLPYANRYANQRENGGIRKCSPMSTKRSDLQHPDTDERPRTRFAYLGVKWSQVQILSARPSLPLVADDFAGRRGRLSSYTSGVCSAIDSATPSKVCSQAQRPLNPSIALRRCRRWYAVDVARDADGRMPEQRQIPPTWIWSVARSTV
jgi:hypothetical protein